jgi:AraC-like DNA-binding protein
VTRRAPRTAQTRCDCGWQSKVTTAGLAARALAVHSCDLHRAKVARAARVAARRSDPGTVRDCTHKVARHQHGTRAAFVLDRCTCRPCRDANTAVEAHRRKEQAYGRWQPYIEAEPARQHVRLLQARGMGWKRVAHAAGLSPSVLWKLLYGDPSRNLAPSKRIRPSTAAAILNVTADLDALGARTPVDATGTRRRLQALVAAGWSMSQLAQRLNRQPSNFNRLFYETTCGAATARQVRALYAELWMTPPPEATHRQRIAATRARNLAAQKRWPPPLWWDDDDIDDPTYTAASSYRPVRAAS